MSPARSTALLAFICPLLRPPPIRLHGPAFQQVSAQHRSPQLQGRFSRKQVTMSEPSTTKPITLPPTAEEQNEEDPTIQYVVVRRDLLDIWPTGSVIAQAVHASVAAIWESRGDEATASYCGQGGNGSGGSASPQMRTVVLEAKNEAAVERLALRLDGHDIEYVMWREQPEGIVTALAAKPYPRSVVKKHFGKFKLFK